MGQNFLCESSLRGTGVGTNSHEALPVCSCDVGVEPLSTINLSARHPGVSTGMVQEPLHEVDNPLRPYQTP